MDERIHRLDEPHIRPLMRLVERLRSRGCEVPNVDPNDGGVKASALFLLETPGPRAVSSGFVSRDNRDKSAENLARELGRSGFDRGETLIWNVMPYCVSTKTANHNATVAQIREAAPDTQAFIDLLSDLKVVVFCGLKAQSACRFLRLRPGVCGLKTFHPGARSYNRQHCQQSIKETFQQAREMVRPT